MKRILFTFLGCVVLSLPVTAQKRAIHFDDLWSMRRIESLVVSPDGEWLASTAVEGIQDNSPPIPLMTEIPAGALTDR
jgi:hypothetical protein